MIFFTHALVVFFLTLVMTVFSVSVPLCNLLIIYVVFLALLSPGLPTGIFGALLAGIVNDGVSAAAFGIFTLSFFWLFCMVRVLRRFIQPSSLFFAFLAVIAGIILENFFILTSLFFGEAQGEVWPLSGKVLMGETLSALVLVPLVFSVLHRLEPWLFYPRKTNFLALALRSSSRLK